LALQACGPMMHSPAHLLDTLLARHGLARPLAGAGVGARPLAAHRQAAAVAQAPVGLDVLEAGNVLLPLAAPRAPPGVLRVGDARDAGPAFSSHKCASRWLAPSWPPPVSSSATHSQRVLYNSASPPRTRGRNPVTGSGSASSALPLQRGTSVSLSAVMTYTPS